MRHRNFAILDSWLREAALVEMSHHPRQLSVLLSTRRKPLLPCMWSELLDHIACARGPAGQVLSLGAVFLRLNLASLTCTVQSRACIKNTCSTFIRFKQLQSYTWLFTTVRVYSQAGLILLFSNMCVYIYTGICIMLTFLGPSLLKKLNSKVLAFNFMF